MSGLFFYSIPNMDTLTEINKKDSETADAGVALKIAIQGYPGAFHDIAARHFFKERKLDIVPGDTFDDLVDAIQEKDADLGLMAIENTLAGSIMSNYYRLLENGLEAIGEIYLRIRQNLMTLPGQKIEDLKEVYSHPMAIAQCKKFFHQYPHIHLVEAEDTALSAKWIQEKKNGLYGMKGLLRIEEV